MPPVEQRRLANGLHVIVVRDRWVPLIAVRVRYHVGSAHDPPERRGLAHLAEHLAFRSLQHIEDGDVARHLHRASAVGNNASTYHWHTDYYESVPSRDLETVLWVESERMGFFAEPKPTVFAEEIAVVNAEGVHRYTGGALEHEIALTSMLFPAPHPYAASHIDRHLPELRAEDVLAFAQAHMGPANATLILVGDVPDDVDAIVDRWFGELTGGRAPAAPLGMETPLSREVRATRSTPPGSVPAAVVAWRLPEPSTERDDAIAYTFAWTFDHCAPAEDLPGVTSIGGSVHHGVRGGVSALQITASGEGHTSPAALVNVIDALLARLRADSVSQSVLARARRRLVTWRAGLQESYEDLAFAILECLERDPRADLDAWARAVREVDTRDLQTFALQHLGPRRAILLLQPEVGAR